MGALDRITMPENFYDITSAMLLVQPEPQYVYAQMYKNALALSLQVPSLLGLPGRGIGGAGAEYANETRDRLELSDPLSGEIFAATVDFAAKPGSSIRINRPVYTDSTYTAASRIIASGTTISTTPITPKSQQTNLTLYKFGGPYDTAVQPYGIEAFDAQMGVFKSASIVGTHMRRDFDKFLESVWVTLFDLAATAVYPQGMASTSTPTTLGDYPFQFEQLLRTEKLMNQANLPTFGDGYRLLVLTPQQCADLALDGNYTNLARNMPQYNSLFPSYIASVRKFHIFQSTTLNTTANANSVNIQYGHAIAPGAGLAGMGRAPRVAANTNDNYGETALVVWLADLAFALANNTFVYSVRSA